MARVSVVLPVHNGERVLGEAIQSVLGQTFHDLELLVVDDGFIDNAEAAVRQFKGQIIDMFSGIRTLASQFASLGLIEPR